MKQLLIAVLIGLSGTISLAQEEIPHYESTLSIEFGGAGGYYSLNFERSLKEKNDWTLGAKGGVCIYHFMDFDRTFNPDMVIPLGLTGRWGKTHHLEMVLGQSIGSFVVLNEDFNKERDLNLSFFAETGYRYQKPGGRFMARIYYSPYYLRYSEWKNWFGLGFGYAF